MVYSSSAIAVAVIALQAVSTLAAPVDLEASTSIVTREYEGAFDELVERAPTDTLSTLATVPKPTTTTTTILSTPTAGAPKNAKTTKTVVVLVQQAAKTCKASRISVLEDALKDKSLTRKEKRRLTNRLRDAKRLKAKVEKRKAKLVAEAKKLERAKAKKEAREKARLATIARKNAKAGITTTASSTSSSLKPTTTATTTKTANWSAITPPPLLKGQKVSEKKVVRSGVTTILRTVTNPPAACPTGKGATDKVKRDFEIDELD